MTSRSNTEFSKSVAFEKLLNEYDTHTVAVIISHLIQFEDAWHVSKRDGELPSGYHFEAYTNVDGPYRLCQIRVGPKRGYRALVMFLNGRPEAYWIYTFKKVKDKQPEDMDRAHSLARQIWDTVRRGNHDSR